jgi:hypothetical protein
VLLRGRLPLLLLLLRALLLMLVRAHLHPRLPHGGSRSWAHRWCELPPRSCLLGLLLLRALQCWLELPQLQDRLALRLGLRPLR